MKYCHYSLTVVWLMLTSVLDDWSIVMFSTMVGKACLFMQQANTNTDTNRRGWKWSDLCFHCTERVNLYRMLDLLGRMCCCATGDCLSEIAVIWYVLLTALCANAFVSRTWMKITGCIIAMGIVAVEFLGFCLCMWLKCIYLHIICVIILLNVVKCACIASMNV